MKKVLVIDYGAGNLKSISKALEVLGLEVEISSSRPLHCSSRSARRWLHQYDLVVLPGVGEFGSAMKLIRKTGIDEFVNLHIRLSKPLLAICLGMQLLFNKSEENINVAGLKLLDGKVVKFSHQHDAKLPVPHMCWNKVKFVNPVRNDRLLFLNGVNPVRNGRALYSALNKELSSSFYHPHSQGLGLSNGVNITAEKKLLLKGLKNEELFYFVHSYYPIPKEKSIVFGVTDYIDKFASMIVKNNIVATQFHLEKSGKSGLKLLKNIVEYFRRI